MNHGLFITATGTGVGKTVLSALIADLFCRNGKKTAYFKPVQTGISTETNVCSDAGFVNLFCKTDLLITKTAYTFPLPASPHLASEQAGVTIQPKMIQSIFLDLLQNSDVTVVEGAGGILVPLTRNPLLMTAQLPGLLNIPVILAARAGLGTINETALTCRYLSSIGYLPKAIFLMSARTEPDLIEKDNLIFLKELTGVSDIYWIPHLAGIDTEQGQTGNPDHQRFDFPSIQTIEGWIK